MHPPTRVMQQLPIGVATLGQTHAGGSSSSTEMLSCPQKVYRMDTRPLLKSRQAYAVAPRLIAGTELPTPPHSLLGTRPPRPSPETTPHRRNTQIVWTSTTPLPRDVSMGRHQETSRQTALKPRTYTVRGLLLIVNRRSDRPGSNYLARK